MMDVSSLSASVATASATAPATAPVTAIILVGGACGLRQTKNGVSPKMEAGETLQRHVVGQVHQNGRVPPSLMLHV